MHSARGSVRVRTSPDAAHRRFRIRARGAPRGGRGAADGGRLPPACCRSSRGSSTSAGAARAAGSRGATSTSGIGPENATCYPNPGELVIYPGGVSEAELLLAYGYVAFASKAGALAGNHFATVVDGNEHLREIGRRLLWDGAQEIVFSES